MWPLSLIIGRERREKMRQQGEDLDAAHKKVNEEIEGARKAALDLVDEGAKHRHVFDDTVRKMESLTDRIQGVWGAMVDRMHEQ